MKHETLHDLYIYELKDLHNAEHQLLKSLPKMAKAASAPQLAKLFTDHLAETIGHVDRLETILSEFDVNPKGKSCRAMEGLLDEGKEVMTLNVDPTVRDAALIATAANRTLRDCRLWMRADVRLSAGLRTGGRLVRGNA